MLQVNPPWHQQPLFNIFLRYNNNRRIIHVIANLPLNFQHPNHVAQLHHPNTHMELYNDRSNNPPLADLNYADATEGPNELQA
ncbi:hypothetical protein GOP47_0030229 [Adiantum capillus-veneris]|nr:hypothetical protein GOP47_0030229 [Adiantum capillus-veneris]